MNLISIAMPAYNAGKYIAETIESIIAQTYKDWELIIVDDCSTDTTVSIIEQYIKKNNKITLIKRRENSGGCRLPRFDAILAANGEFVCPIDADDTIEEQYLEKLVKRQKETNADIVLGRMVICDESQVPKGATIPQSSYDLGKILSGKDACKETIGGWKIAMAGMLAKTLLYKDYITTAYNIEGNGGFHDEIDHRKLILCANCVAMIDAHYLYRQQPLSIIHSSSIRSYDILGANKKLIKLVEEVFNKDQDITKKALMNYLDSIYRAQQRYYMNKSIYNNTEKKQIRFLIMDSYKDIKEAGIKPQEYKDWILLRSFCLFKLYTWGITKILKLKK